MVDAFALARETAERVLGMRPYDVQVLAGIAIHQGKLVEMVTGEGKTLTVVLPACLNALTGRGVHVLTFNDYLARRDASWMSPVYRFIGLTFGTIQEGMSTDQRSIAYRLDITYATAKEARITKTGIDIEAEGLQGTSATWTCLMSDRALSDLHQMLLGQSNSAFTAVAVLTTWPLLAIAALRERLKKVRK